MFREKTLEPTKQSDAETYHLPVGSLSAEFYSDDNYEIFDTIAHDKIASDIPDDEKREAISQAFELYLATKTNVAPVIVGFADELLRTAEGRQIIFAARDGLGAFEAAKVLLGRFRDEYAATAEDLVFAYLTRKIVQSTDPEILTEYLKQTGVRDTDAPLVIADIGMYGTIMYGLDQILPRASASYIISRNPGIPGYADDDRSRRMDCFASIIGNPAVHFMEDTFSGSTSSPSRLEERDGMLNPNFTEDAFEPKELLKRKYAIQAIVDCAATVEHTPTGDERHRAIETLDTFLLDKDNYVHLMVPHIR